MKFWLSVVLSVVVVGFSAAGRAEDKVVVIPLGGGTKAGLTWKGDWAADTVYKAGDAVQEDGSSYVCTAGHTASGANYPPNGAYWDLLAAQGDTGAQGPQGIQGVAGTNAMELKNIVTVSATGGDYTTPANALASIT